MARLRSRLLLLHRCRSTCASAGSAPAPAPVSEKVTFAADAFFDFDKAVLKPDGKRKLDDLASKLQGMNLEVIIAVGHTDSIGTDAYNQKLSVRRAEAVKAYMVSKGIEANRVYTEGKGEKQPVARQQVCSRPCTKPSCGDRSCWYVAISNIVLFGGD